MNALAGEKSPYLLQHKDNPVEWWPWGPEAFAEARKRQVPVFLSIGYSTCHWCHVMAHESFESPAIAGQMNAGFVNIKVDREERPDVDRLHMAFVQSTTGSGGWPLSVWLTPDGKPFFGGTYFPPEDRSGRAGFPNVLGQITALWAKDQPRIEKEGKRVMEALGQKRPPVQTETVFSPEEEPLKRAFADFSASFDGREGGFGSAPKFPRPVTLNFLFRYADRDPHAAEMGYLTLRKMAAGGLRDHLGGGFHRYAVDGVWHVPHFEKMLYDQAQLAISYVEAWQGTHDEFFAGVARETLDYVLRDLTHPEGGFFSAEDADSARPGSGEQAEGAFYVWSATEIAEVLGAEEAEVFGRHYGVESEGNAPAGSDPHGEFTGLNILIARGNPEEAQALASSRQKLFQRREARPRPQRDDKVLTAWNGLMISALAKAGAALAEPRYLEAAARAARFLKSKLRKDDRLLRSWREEPGAIEGFAEDYASLIQALLDLYEATFEEEWLAWALELQELQDELFWDHEDAGYFSSAAGDALVPLRMKEDYDGAEPSANAISALNLLRLSRIFNADDKAEQAGKVLASSRELMERSPSALPQMLVALDFALAPPQQAVVAGTLGSPDLMAWRDRLHRDFFPRRVSLFADAKGIAARANPALAELPAVEGKATLYLCENFSCQLPQTLPDSL